MLDLGLTKMALIGVVALVVLGPERLPRVARTAGALFGRAQRYVNDVKTEVTREIELEELRRMKTDFESTARSVENKIHEGARQHEAELNEAWRDGTSVSSRSITEGAAAEDAVQPSHETRDNRRNWLSAGGSGARKRRNWRAKRLVAPLWYKRAMGHRSHVQSGAARMARHLPASLRKPKRFL